MMAVSTAPASRPSTGFLEGDEQLPEGRHIRQTAHGGRHGSMPNISVAKPSSTVKAGVFFFLLSLQNMKKMIPTSAALGVGGGPVSRTHMRCRR